jgi:hypothetical protein
VRERRSATSELETVSECAVEYLFVAHPSMLPPGYDGHRGLGGTRGCGGLCFAPREDVRAAGLSRDELGPRTCAGAGILCGMNETDAVVEELVVRCRRDFNRWINGDGSGYALPQDGTIYGPFGGTAHRGGPEFAALQQAAAQKWWISGDGDIELITGGVSAEIAWLVYIERATVMFAGREEPRRWELRITDLFRREAGTWERFHIHEDACVDPRSIDAVLAQLP